MRKIFAAAPLAMLGIAGGCSSGGPSRECSTNTTEALNVCATGPVTKGLDVSYYQGTVDFARVKAAGTVFVITRVSDGVRVQDAKFTENWPGIKAAGLIRGVYQFFRPAQDPIAQADLLLSKIGTLAPDDLPPVLDVEAVDGQTPATIQANMKIWLDRVEQSVRRKPMIYTAAFMSASVGTAFAAYPLWVANYGVTCPKMPSTWMAWQFWQTSNKGAIPGIAGDVDLDVFNGTLADLLKFANSGTPSLDAGTPSLDAGTPPPPLPSDGGNGASMGEGQTPAPVASGGEAPCR